MRLTSLTHSVLSSRKSGGGLGLRSLRRCSCLRSNYGRQPRRPIDMVVGRNQQERDDFVRRGLFEFDQ